MIKNNQSISQSYDLLEKLIGKHIKLHTDKKKTLEICHTGKFLLFFENLYISSVCERPDFILCDGNKEIGLEHQIIVEPKSKEREGFFESIFAQAEKELQRDNELPNFLANCYINYYATYKLNQKDKLVESIKTVIKEYVLKNEFVENTIIDSISLQPHSQKNIHANMGGWWPKSIPKEILESAIIKKDAKVSSYKQNGVKTQWLLLVIGSNGESSFEMDQDLKLEIETNFDKVFVLEDFKNILYELK